MKKPREEKKQKSRETLVRIGRFFLSLLISAGILWFGITFSPCVKPGGATVIDRFTNPRPAVQAIPGISWEGVREFRINGGSITVEHGKTGTINSSELWPVLKKYSGDLVAGGEEEGFLAGLPAGRGQALKLLARGSDIGGLVSAFLVLPRKSPGADLFVFSPSGLGLANFLALGGNDAPGRDPEDLPRLPLSQRLVSIQSAGSPPLLQAAVYRCPGSPTEAKRFLTGRLAREGWESPGTSGGSDLLNFRRGKSLLAIGIKPEPESSVLITVATITQ